MKHLMVFLTAFFLITQTPLSLWAKDVKDELSEKVEDKSWKTLPPAVEEEASLAGNALEDAEEAVPADALGEAAEPAPSSWDAYPPSVKVSLWGSEIRIVVTPNPVMGKERIAAIQTVKMESEKGDFLGLKTFSPTETERISEFMVNPEMLKMDKVKIIATSLMDGVWTALVSLEVKAEPSPTAEAEVSPVGATDESAPAAVPAEGAAPKKKGWLW